MDEIAECIADHKYNEAIRKGADGEVDPASVILERMPAPLYFEAIVTELSQTMPNFEFTSVLKVQVPKTLRKKEKSLYHESKEALSTILKNLTKESMMETPIGRFALAEAALTKQNEGAELTRYPLEKSDLASIQAILNQYTILRQNSAPLVSHLKVMAFVIKENALTPEPLKEQVDMIIKLVSKMDDASGVDTVNEISRFARKLSVRLDATDVSILSDQKETSNSSQKSSIKPREETETGDDETEIAYKMGEIKLDFEGLTSRASQGPYMKVVDGMKSELKDGDGDQILSAATLLDLMAEVYAKIGSLCKELNDSLGEAFDYFCTSEKAQFLREAFLKAKWYACFRKMDVEDFLMFRDLGRGAFGVVSGARHKVTGKMVALKGINRKQVKGRKCEKLIQEEKDILQLLGCTPSNFAVSLSFCCFDKYFIYLALPLLTGGDLSFHLSKIVYFKVNERRKSLRMFTQSLEEKDKGDSKPNMIGALLAKTGMGQKGSMEELNMESFKRKPELIGLRGFAVEVASFFAAEIFLGLVHLHSLGIIYRDMKPENILLDEFGHTQISDLGLAMVTDTSADEAEDVQIKGRAGTPGYWPPEMLKQEEYSFDCDWWSYACTIYELFYGMCPFSERITGMDRERATLEFEVFYEPLPPLNSAEVHEGLGLNLGKVFAENNERKDPETGEIINIGYDKQVKDFLGRLLEKDRSKRLGVGRSPAAEIRNHPVFSHVDWEQMGALKAPVPWKPPENVINAHGQSEIEARNTEEQFRKLKIDEKDDKWAESMYYVSQFELEKELAQVLRFDFDGKLGHLDKEAESSVCVLL